MVDAVDVAGAGGEAPKDGPLGVTGHVLGALGPGLITGAADDDPSGIGTYSQIGAQFGYSMGWTMTLTFPLMVAIQEISARIGCTTGHGIATNLRRHYPRWILDVLVLSLLVANVINLGADIAAMATRRACSSAATCSSGWWEFPSRRCWRRSI